METGIKDIILTGDFNADKSTNITAGKAMETFLNSNPVYQHVLKPTRIVDGHKSKLDLLITSSKDLIKDTDVVSPVYESDHSTVIATLHFKTTRTRCYTRTMWSYKNANFDDYRNELRNSNLDDCIKGEDIDKDCEDWTDLFLKITSKVIPNKIVTVRPSDKSWYNNHLRHLCTLKERAFTYFTRNDSEESKTFYNKAKNHYNDECRKAQAKFKENKYKEMEENNMKADQKSWWSSVKSLLGRSKGSAIPALYHQRKVYTDDKEKAEIFNQTYLESSNLENQPNQVPDLPDPDHELLNDIVITEKEVNDILLSLDVTKSYGPDKISPKMLKEARPSIVSSLTKLFNNSLRKGIFPALWKKANVTPILKKCEEYFASNYRPVSLLCCLSKVFEKIVFKHMYNHFKKHFLISIWQSGFLPGSSTITQLLELYNNFCEAVTKEKEIRIVFLDISKAFDRVWHAGLLAKLKASGIGGRLIRWLENYLKSRQQRVGINGQFSNWGEIKAGVPKGSVLGPLLFSIFSSYCGTLSCS